MMTPVCFVVLGALISTSSQARSSIKTPLPNPDLMINSVNHQVPIPSIKTPLPNPDFMINSANHQNEGTCVYTLRIVTSCSSVQYTRDQISISFGDAYGNQVYAPGIEDPSTRTFERCSADTFAVYGPCTYQICYVYLYRSGIDRWLPLRVEVYGYNTKAVSFDYNDWIPANMWYGFNYCSRYANGDDSSSKSTMK